MPTYRRCSNPACFNFFARAFGFPHSGDYLQCWEGKIMPEQIRELCGKCGLRLSLMDERGESDIPFMIKIGWHLPIPQLLLPAPR